MNERKLFAGQYRVAPISRRTAMQYVVRFHYLHRVAPCEIAFGLLDTSSAIMGVICYGTPSSATLRAGIAGPEYASAVTELTRLWVSDAAPRNGESYLIGNSIPRVNKPIIVSFADTAQSHIGTIYQATNWLYTGLSAKRTDWAIAGDARHGQTHADKYTAQEIRAAFGDRFSLRSRSRKHRYVFINAKRPQRMKNLHALRYPILPYPKLDAEAAAPALHI